MTVAGWYPDPQQPNIVRFWDGTQWTQHVQPGPPQPAQYQTAQYQPAQYQPAQYQPAQYQQQYQPPQYQQPQQTNPQPAYHQQAGPAVSDLQSVLTQLQVPPRPTGNGTIFGEPTVLLIHNLHQPGVMEWWTPQGLKVGSAVRQAPVPDPVTGEEIYSSYALFTSELAPLGSVRRVNEPFRPRLFADTPQGPLGTLQSDKALSLRVGYTWTDPAGQVLSRVTAEAVKGDVLTLADPAGQPLARLYKNGKWTAGVKGERKTRWTPTSMVAGAVVDAVFDIDDEPIAHVVVLERPLSNRIQALMALQFGIAMEQFLSLH